MNLNESNTKPNQMKKSFKQLKVGNNVYLHSTLNKGYFPIVNKTSATICIQVGKTIMEFCTKDGSGCDSIWTIYHTKEDFIQQTNKLILVNELTILFKDKDIIDNLKSLDNGNLMEIKRILTAIKKKPNKKNNNKNNSNNLNNGKDWY